MSIESWPPWVWGFDDLEEVYLNVRVFDTAGLKLTFSPVTRVFSGIFRAGRSTAALCLLLSSHPRAALHVPTYNPYVPGPTSTEDS
ncbi:MAG: hypothetical protein H6Q55_1568 [Deltaproteobacteria bacterium]|jgi:hypothetical protein|nr:hypothetical protein [Deltaproteobacteria bacterium]